MTREGRRAGYIEHEAEGWKKGGGGGGGRIPSVTMKQGRNLGMRLGEGEEPGVCYY